MTSTNFPHVDKLSIWCLEGKKVIPKNIEKIKRQNFLYEVNGRLLKVQDKKFISTGKKCGTLERFQDTKIYL